jgi:hypothetical protein
VGSVLNLGAVAAFGERHVQCDSGDYGLPSFILGETAPFDRAPKMDDLFLGYAFEQILISVVIENLYGVHEHGSGTGRFLEEGWNVLFASRMPTS